MYELHFSGIQLAFIRVDNHTGVANVQTVKIALGFYSNFLGMPGTKKPSSLENK